MEAIIRTEGLTKIYRVNGREVKAVDNLNLTVYEGELFGYLGPNGSGKTTTILMLLGLINPSRGRGWVANYDITKESKKIRTIAGYIPERYSFYEDLSAYRNLKFFGKLNGISDSEIDDRIKWALELVELHDWINSPVKTFSRGMKQRLALANVLIKKPKVIFLDEPTAGLDPHARAKFRELIKRLNEELGLTVFLSSHMLHEVRQICNRIGFLMNGKLIAIDTIDGFISKMGYKIVFELTKINDEIISAVKSINGVNKVFRTDNQLTIYAGRDVRLELSKLANDFNAHILTLKLETPTLEEVFFNIYGGGTR